MEARGSAASRPKSHSSLAIGANHQRPASAGGFSPESSKEWAHELQRGDVRSRRAAALTLARAPSEAVMFGETLRDGLCDDDAKVRSTVAASLGRMGRVGSQYAPDLEDLLRNDGEAEVRAGAVRALGFLDAQAVRDQRAAASSASSAPQKGGVRRSASASAVTSGPGANTASRQAASRRSNDAGGFSHTAVLVAALKDADIKVRTAAEVALRNVNSATNPRRCGSDGKSRGSGSRGAKSRILQDAELRSRGLTGDLGEDSGLYARLLAQRLDNPDPQVRRWTAETLGVIGSAAKPHAETLATMAKDGNEDERVQLAADKASQKILCNPKGEADSRGRSGKRRGASRGKKAASPKKAAAGAKKKKASPKRK